MIERACLNCGWILTAAKPQDGNVLVCVNCATVLIFTADRELRLPTKNELPGLMARPDVFGMVSAVEGSNEEDEP